MKITLYANCILNGNYREVFDTRGTNISKSPFEKYLDTLSKITIGTKTGLPQRYMTDSGTLNIPIVEITQFYELVNSAYTYNYMCMEGYTESIDYDTGRNDGRIMFNRRYFFIDNVTLSNDMAIIKYSIDYWHTFHGYLWTDNTIEGGNYTTGRSFKTRYGSLLNSKIINYNVGTQNEFKVKFYKPPMEYTGNNALKYEKLKIEDEREDCYLILTLSLYGAEQSGVYSKRKTETCICYLSDIQEPVSNFKFESTYFSVDQNSTLFSKAFNANMNYTKVINDMILFSSDSNSHLHDTTYKYYSVLSAKVIPFTMAHYELQKPLDLSNTSTPIEVLDYVTMENGKQLLLIPVKFLAYQGDVGSAVKLYEKTISNDFKNIGVGFYTQLFPIVPNGNDVKLEVFVFLSRNNCRLMLSLQNTFYDITSCLDVDLPIQAEDANTMALAKVTRELKKTTLENQKGIVISNYIGGVISQAFDTIGSIVDLGTSKFQFGGLGNVISNTGGLASILGPGMASLDLSLNSIEKELEANSAKVFTSNKGILCENSPDINACYGLLLFKINPDNSTEVTASIENFGYTCSEIVNAKQILDLDSTTASNEKYNVVKFSSITVYGSFPDNVARILESILMNGVKIWYTHEIQ